MIVSYVNIYQSNIGLYILKLKTLVLALLYRKARKRKPLHILVVKQKEGNDTYFSKIFCITCAKPMLAQCNNQVIFILL